uniref:sensor histidine kinase n=1 Tax=Saccharothrix mutabilis TaxID=33921 RepID=UPI0031D543F2
MRVILWVVVAALPVAWGVVTARPGRVPPWEAVAWVAVLAVAVPLARRWPVTALVVTAVAWQVAFLARAAVDSTVAAGLLATGLVVVAFLAGRHAVDGERGAVALVLLAAGAATTTVVVTGAGDASVAAASGIAAFAAVPWTVGRYRRQYTAMVEAGWARAEQLEREADHVRDRERARLAADMHDLVGHELARAALLVGALEVAPSLAADQREAARVARGAVTSAAERLADVVGLLRAGEPEPAESVEDVVARARRSGLRVEVTGDGVGEVDPVIARTAHRVLTEAVTNAIKHAPGEPVAVDVRRTDDGLALHITTGIKNHASAALPSGGRGLLGLSERVALVGGTFSAGARAGGFEVAAHLPAKPVTTAVPHRHRVEVERQVRRSARRTVLATAGIAAAIVLAVLSYIIYDAATSVLDPEYFARLRVGQPQSEVVLPRRDRVDSPDNVPPPPPGAACRHFSTHANPFDERRLDLYRVCFRDGRLVDKALLRRDP